MRVLDIKVFEGRNIYAHFPVTRISVELGNLTNRESHECEGFVDSLLGHLPGLSEHHCASRARGFVERLRSGTYFGHVLEHVFLELQAMAGYARNFGKARHSGVEGIYHVVVEHACSAAVDPLVRLAMELIAGCLRGEQVELGDKLALIKALMVEHELGPSTASIVAAAKKRGISVKRLGADSLVQLGTGKYMRRVQATVGPATSCLAADISCDKSMTKHILGQAGIPVPFGVTVQTLAEAQAAWSLVGRPVAIKPSDGNQGKGVSLNLNSPEDIEEGFELARRYSPKLIVEEYIEGKHYRLLVVGGRLIAAAERIPAHVVGDGSSSISRLVTLANQDPMRGEKHEKPLTRMVIDELVLGVLKRQGYSPASVPPKGAAVYLRGSANLSTGGTAVDVTAEVHPTVVELAERVARLIGLDIAGIDVVMPDIASPLSAGSVIEVNAAPGIRMHHYPSIGQARDVASAIVDTIYPPGAQSEVPLVTVTGTNGKTTTTRLIAAGLRKVYSHVGCATSAGIYINDRMLVSGDTTGPWSAGVLLSDPLVEAAALEVARGGIIRGGLGYDCADVAVVTNITDDHIGQDGVLDLDDLCHVKSLVAEAVRPGGQVVVNAGNPYSLRAGFNSRRELVMFDTKPSHLLTMHLSRGGRAIYVDCGDLIIAEGSQVIGRIEVKSIPITFEGKALHNVENVAAAVGAMWSIGIPQDLIVAALQEFMPDFSCNPGRQNLVTVANVSVMIDYGHNTRGVEAVASLARSLCSGRLIGVVCAPGDRADESIVELGQMVGQKFDHVFIKEDKELRGRKPGEVASLLEKGLTLCGSADKYSVLLDEHEALRQSIGLAGGNDMVVVFYESLDATIRSLKTIENELNHRPTHMVVAGVVGI